MFVLANGYSFQSIYKDIPIVFMVTNVFYRKFCSMSAICSTFLYCFDSCDLKKKSSILHHENFLSIKYI